MGASSRRFFYVDISIFAYYFLKYGNVVDKAVARIRVGGEKWANSLCGLLFGVPENSVERAKETTTREQRESRSKSSPRKLIAVRE
jgi:hypothetical protein